MRKLSVKILFICSLFTFLIGYPWHGEFEAFLPGNTALADVQQDNPQAAKAAKSPKAVFPEIKHEFGSILEGAEIKHDFIIENHGQAPLKIDRVQPD